MDWPYLSGNPPNQQLNPLYQGFNEIVTYCSLITRVTLIIVISFSTGGVCSL